MTKQQFDMQRRMGKILARAIEEAKIKNEFEAVVFAQSALITSIGVLMNCYDDKRRVRDWLVKNINAELPKF